ncbi:hypothetical protein V8C42DRAFT_337864 [Trichoderma barbatum]
MEPIKRIPREIVYRILQSLPNIDTLINAVLAHPIFHEVFTVYETSIATVVLQREIPHQHYTQALCHFIITKGNYCLPMLAGVGAYQPYIASFMKGIRHQCDRVQRSRMSLSNARFISRTDKKVADMCEALIRDGFFPERQALFPLDNVIDFPKPTQAERTRVHQGIYLYNLLECLCKNLKIDDYDHAAGSEDFREELQQSIIEHLMAPWEFYHAIGIRIYLCRALYRLTSIPSIVVSGIDVLHHILCVVGPSRLGMFEKPYGIAAHDSGGLAFGSILSKALSNSWSHKWKEAAQSYRPLWTDSEVDLDGWKKFEARQFEALGSNPPLSDVIKHDISLLDGSFGLWGATLWDENRWDDIVELTAETSTDTHLDPMALGILLVEEKTWSRRNAF